MTAKIEWSQEAIQAAWKAFNVASENPMKNALNAACEIQGIECLRAENEKLKIQCDEEYLSGMKHGWNCCASNNEARYQQSVNTTREQIVAARAAAAAIRETGDE